MPWGWFSKPQKPEEKYATQLKILEEKGYKDTLENIKKLDLYGGEVQHVISDFELHAPSGSSHSVSKEQSPIVISTNNDNNNNNNNVIETQNDNINNNDSIQNDNNNNNDIEKNNNNNNNNNQQILPPTATDDKPIKQQSQKQEKPIEKSIDKPIETKKSQTSEKSQSQQQPQQQTSGKQENKQQTLQTQPSANSNLKHNLTNLTCHEIKELFHQIGETSIGGLLYTHSISGYSHPQIEKKHDFCVFFCCVCKHEKSQLFFVSQIFCVF